MNSQRISLRMSEVRQRLNELSAVETPTDEQTAELQTLMDEHKSLEVRYRAAVTAEGEEETRRQNLEGAADGEGTELRALRSRARLGSYIVAALRGARPAGAEAELSQALGEPEPADGSVAVPWTMFDGGADAGAAADEPERRASSTTAALTGGTVQRPVLQRLFGRDVLDALGVRLDAVPAGRSRWPLLTDGAGPLPTAEDASGPAAVAPSFSTTVLQPHRLTGRYVFTVEQAAEVMDLEQALRRDLVDAARAAMCNQVLSGDGTGAEVRGFYTAISAPPDPTDEADYGDYAAAPAMVVDGIHAGMESQVGAVLGVHTYQHAAGVFQAGSGESGLEAMVRRGRAIMASNYVPAPASNIQKGNIFHAGGDAMRGDSIAAVWPSLNIIRDIYTDAAEGRVRLTWLILWDAYVAFRSRAYRRRAFKLA